MKNQNFWKVQIKNLCSLLFEQTGCRKDPIQAHTKLKYLFLVYFITVCACSPNSGTGSSGEFQKPSCPSPSEADSKELERKKRDLFQDIENSDRYQSSSIREKSLKRYKHVIKTKEQTSCHKDVIRFIEKISKLHRK